MQDVCSECSPKLSDRSEKEVFLCDFCQRTFCVVHKEARLVRIPDFAMDPKIERTKWWRTLQVELMKIGGHPCFPYTFKFWGDFEAESAREAAVISKVLDYMLKNAQYFEAENARCTPEGAPHVETTQNKYGYRFLVPHEVYSDPKYREYLDYAQSMKSAGVIVDQYYKEHPKANDIPIEVTTKKQQEPKKKKRWWQGRT